MGNVNKFALGMNKGGRPPMFESPEQMEQKINEYFDSLLNEDGELIGHPTVTGLTLYLGFADKKSLREYKAKEGFTPLIKRALTVVEKNYEEMLLSRSPAGAIFALKNMGWEDKQQTDVTSGGEKINVPLIKWVDHDSSQERTDQ